MISMLNWFSETSLCGDFSGRKKSDLLPDDRRAGRGPGTLLLSEREAAKAVGVCPKTLFNARRKGELRGVKIGSRILYKPDDLNEWIDGNKPGNKS